MVIELCFYYFDRIVTAGTGQHNSAAMNVRLFAVFAASYWHYFVIKIDREDKCKLSIIRSFPSRVFDRRSLVFPNSFQAAPDTEYWSNDGFN